MDYSWDYSVVRNNLDVLLWGMFWTFALAAASVSFGLIFGVLLAFLRTSKVAVIKLLSGTFIELFRNLPVLVTMIWMYYCLPLLVPWNVFNSPFLIATLALGLNFAALEAEIFRAGINAIPKSQLEAARGLSFNKKQILRHITLPQAAWRSLTPTLGQVVNTLKLTALASFIVVHELFYQTSALIQESYRPLELYTTLAVLYLIIITPFSTIILFLERNLEKRFTYG